MKGDNPFKGGDQFKKADKSREVDSIKSDDTKNEKEKPVEKSKATEGILNALVQDITQSLNDTSISKRKVKQRFEQFSVRLSWVRRPLKGNGTVFIKCPSPHRSLLLGKSIMINGNKITLHPSKNSNDLVCFGTGDSSPDDIKKQLLLLLNDSKLDDDELERKIVVNMARERRDVPTQEEQSRMAGYLENQFGECLPEDTDGEIIMVKPQASDIWQVAYSQSNNIQATINACLKLENNLKVNGEVVAISQLCFVKHVPDQISNEKSKLIQDMVKGFKENEGADGKVRLVKGGNKVVEITCEQLNWPNAKMLKKICETIDQN